MNILELLYEDCTSFCERLGYDYSKEYRDLKNKSLKLEEELYTHFTEDIKKLYEEVRMSQLERDSLEDLRRFKKSFAFGALLMLEILKEEV